MNLILLSGPLLLYIPFLSLQGYFFTVFILLLRLQAKTDFDITACLGDIYIYTGRFQGYLPGRQSYLRGYLPIHTIDIIR